MTSIMVGIIFLAMLALPFAALVAVAMINRVGNTASTASTTTGSEGSKEKGDKKTVITTAQQHPWWAATVVGVTALLILIFGSPLPLLYDQQVVTLLLVGTGIILIYLAISGKEKKVMQLLFGILLILLAPTLGIIALEVKKEAEAVVDCKAEPSQEKCLVRKVAAPSAKVSTVLLPACSAGWSETVNILPGHGFAWSWTVKAQYRWNGGGWKDHVPTTSINAEAFRFCAKDSQHVGQAMPISWR